MRRHDAVPATSGTEPRYANRASRRRRLIRTLVVAVAITLSLGLAAPGTVAGAEPAAAGTTSIDPDSSETDPAIVVSDATVEPDATETQRVALTEAPDGLAGFKLTLELSDAGVATVTSASYPDRFGLTTDPDVSADGETITVEAADLGDEITPGATGVTLATIDGEGVEPGETELRVTDLQVDADGGDAVDPSLEAGTLTVGDDFGDDSSESSESKTASESDDGGSESTDDGTDADDSDSLPGFAIGPTIAAFAVLAAVLICRFD